MQDVQFEEVTSQFMQVPVQFKHSLNKESAYVVDGQVGLQAKLYKNYTPSQAKHDDEEQLRQ
jgi:hypothetical protein